MNQKENFEIRLETNISEAEKLWNMFSSDLTIYDCWDFRALFQKYHQKEIRFYVGYIDGVLIGVLPLQWNAQKGWIEFFGGDYMEDNRCFLKPEYEMYRVNFYEYLKTLAEPVHLECIRGEDEYTKSLSLQEYKYILPLEGIATPEDYLQKFLKSETRGKFRRKLRDIEEQHTLQIAVNQYEDIGLLFELHMARFGEHSSFNDRPHHKEIFRELLHLPGCQSYLLTFLVDDKKVGVSLALLYKKSYEYFNLGVCAEDELKNINTLVNMKNIEFAIGSGATVFDAFVGSYGWKESWHLQKVPQYKYFVRIDESYGN